MSHEPSQSWSRTWYEVKIHIRLQGESRIQGFIVSGTRWHTRPSKLLIRRPMTEPSTSRRRDLWLVFCMGFAVSFDADVAGTKLLPMFFTLLFWRMLLPFSDWTTAQCKSHEWMLRGGSSDGAGVNFVSCLVQVGKLPTWDSVTACAMRALREGPLWASPQKVGGSPFNSIGIRYFSFRLRVSVCRSEHIPYTTRLSPAPAALPPRQSPHGPSLESSILQDALFSRSFRLSRRRNKFANANGYWFSNMNSWDHNAGTNKVDRMYRSHRQRLSYITHMLSPWKIDTNRDDDRWRPGRDRTANGYSKSTEHWEHTGRSYDMGTIFGRPFW